MNFKLEFTIPESNKKINLHDPIYLIGSCFSDSIGSLLQEHKFKATSNPFGTVYNPHSICRLLRDDISDLNTTAHQDVFYHWDTHSQISGLTQKQLTSELTQARTLSNDFIRKSKWLIITLGTAWVYRRKDNNEIVANCHKHPNTEFTKDLITVEQTVDDFEKLIPYLQSINPSLKIIFTVSPVRHVRDGLIENNRSKSILNQAVHELVEKHDHLFYFPSYEIIIDELRDYRFYKKDLIHPSHDATDYVWERFAAAYFDDATLSFIHKWKKLKTGLEHRPLHANSPSHQKFLKELLKQLQDVNDNIDLRVEIEMLKSQLQ